MSHTKSHVPPVQLVVWISPNKGWLLTRLKRWVSQALLLILYKNVLLFSSFLDSSACSLIYFLIASSVMLPMVDT